MKKIFATGLMAFALLGSTESFAQIQIGAQGSYLKGTGNNNSQLWGGGIHAKFFVGPFIALGGVARAYPTQTSKQTDASGNTITTRNFITNVSGSADIILGSKKDLIQPFIGADAGVSIANQTVVTSTSGSGGNAGASNPKNSQVFFLLSPKAGVNLGLLPSFGAFATAQYNLTFGNGNSRDVSINNAPNPFKSTPVDKYFTFDIGVYFRLTGASK